MKISVHRHTVCKFHMSIAQNMRYDVVELSKFILYQNNIYNFMFIRCLSVQLICKERQNAC